MKLISIIALQILVNFRGPDVLEAIYKL